MRRLINTLTTLAVLSAVCCAGHAQAGDATQPAANLDDILQRLGLTRAGLRIGGAPDWLGHIPPASVPYRLPHLDAIHADPPLLAELGGNLGGVARQARDGGLPAGRLAGLLTAFNLHPRLPAFRGLQSIGNDRELSPGNLTTLLRAARSDDGRTVSFGAHGWHGDDSGVEGPEEVSLPTDLRRPVAHLLGACLEAAWWISNSWRHLPSDTVAVATSLTGITPYLSGADRWYPELTDAATAGDDTARAYAAVLLAQAVQEVLPHLDSIDTKEPGFAALDWEVATPLGRIIVAGTNDGVVDCRQNCLLVIDLGGNDAFSGSAGGARFPLNPVSVLIDLGGDDTYNQGGAHTSQGAGAGGLGLLLDCAGNDSYNGIDGVQGWGFLGYGLLWDLAGQDHYVAQAAAQGAALFGGGLLLDEAGNDTYRAFGESQGFGGPGGAGALVDLEGNDRYYAEPSPALAGRADYHSENRVAANNCQGAGVGRRGDLTDGHLWAGGLGILADSGGNDEYEAGNFSQGIGYWFGTGMLLDGGGDDTFQTVYFTQGAGLHFGAGLLLDENGDDIHILKGEAGASLGYAWDFGVAIFLDGGGDDAYGIEGTGLGCAERRSIALFVDGGGADTYRFGLASSSLGAVDGGGKVSDSRRFSLTSLSSAQAGLFIDMAGTDSYLPTASLEPGFQPTDNRSWLRPRPDDDSPDRPNRGAGIDLAGPAFASDRAPHLFFRRGVKAIEQEPQ